MAFIILFIIMMVWFYFAINVVRSWGVALAMIIIGALVPMGLLALALNVAWYLYQHHKSDANPLVN